MDGWMYAFWVIATGSLVAGSCALLGCYLILRRLAMLGDAISHAILLGIVVAFMLTQSMNGPVMFIGAAVVGVLTTWLVQVLSTGGVHRDAALGVTFASFFALGVIGVSRFGQDVHLDVECVLYGEIALAPLDQLYWGDTPMGPVPVWINGGLFLLNLLVIGLFYKELKITSFDPGLAAALGLPVGIIHYMLMTLVSLTTVGAFESVGVILVVAMLIAPAATAYLLTDRLHIMLMLAVGNGVLSAILGYWVSWMLNCSPAGAMGSMAGVQFAFAFLFSPTHGVITRWWSHNRLRMRVAEEDVLLWAGRQLESGHRPSFTSYDLSQAQRWLLPDAKSAIKRLVKKGLLQDGQERFSLSHRGEVNAESLIKRHRLYEAYLGDLGYPSDHLHDPADRVEHHLTADLTDRLDQAADHPSVDPHGRSIPRGEQGDSSE